MTGTRPRRLLLIEDDRIVGEALCAVIRSFGLDVSLCTSGEDALLRLRSEHFDALLTDYGLQERSGLEYASQIHSEIPELPIMLITAWLVDFSSEALATAGVRQVLRKPVPTAELKRAIRELLTIPLE